MPLRLPDKLPAIELLKKENIFVMDNSRATTQDIRPLKIVVLNLMPLKITTETDLVRLLSNTPLQLDISFMKLKSHTPKNTPIEHMMMFYRDFQVMKDEKFDGMIVTGAPVETYEFEDVTYWDEVSTIFKWARTHVTSTLYICWAAQAGLYCHYGIPKYPLKKKMFGIFKQKKSMRPNRFSAPARPSSPDASAFQGRRPSASSRPRPSARLPHSRRRTARRGRSSRRAYGPPRRSGPARAPCRADP